MQNSMIYLYCLAISRTEPGYWLEMGRLKSFKVGDFYVIVKNIPETDFSEENLRRNFSDKLWVKTNVQDHIAILKKIMEHHEVLPFKFGTVFNDEADLKTYIASHSTTLSRNFYALAGREEWRIQVFCNRKALRRHIDELSDLAAAMEKEIMASSPGKAHLLIRNKTGLIESEMDRICKNYSQEYLDEFNRLSDLYSLNNLLPKEYTEREDNMILNANFLVHKNKHNMFQETLETSRKKGVNFGFFLEISGPDPPLSFISQVKK